MPHLDSHLHQPTFTGPTRNLAAEAAAQPVYREEAFQIKAKRLPISLNANLKPRPRAREANVGAGNRLMTTARTPVLVRMSNQRPLEAGTGTSAQEWNVSTPQSAPARLAGLGHGGGHGGGHHGGGGHWGGGWGGWGGWGPGGVIPYDSAIATTPSVCASETYKGYVISGCDGYYSVAKGAQVVGTFRHYDAARSAVDMLAGSKPVNGLGGYGSMLPGMGADPAPTSTGMSFVGIGVAIGLVAFLMTRKHA